jgi:hypothetical protein
VWQVPVNKRTSGHRIPAELENERESRCPYLDKLIIRRPGGEMRAQIRVRTLLSEVQRSTYPLRM